MLKHIRCDNHGRTARRGPFASGRAHFRSRWAPTPASWGSDMHFVKLVSGICGGFLRRPAASAGTCAVSGDSVMKASRTLKQAALAGFLALAFLVFGGGSNPSAATVINCTGGQTPSMTIVIYNNSSIASGGYNIYPVLFAGAESKTDEWMQACFQGTDRQLKSYPFPRASQYRMYVNCCATDKNGNPLPNENGIPP